MNEIKLNPCYCGDTPSYSGDLAICCDCGMAVDNFKPGSLDTQYDETAQIWNSKVKHDRVVISDGVKSKFPEMSWTVNNKLHAAIKSFVNNLNEGDILNVIIWVDDRLYFEVRNESFGQYPFDRRFLVSFNLDDGKFYSGKLKHCVVRKGWEDFATKLLDYTPVISSDE